MTNDTVRGYLLLEAVRRARNLGWRSISMRRLNDIIEGNTDRLPPDVTLVPQKYYDELVKELGRKPSPNEALMRAARRAREEITRA